MKMPEIVVRVDTSDIDRVLTEISRRIERTGVAGMSETLSPTGLVVAAAVASGSGRKVSRRALLGLRP